MGHHVGIVCDSTTGGPVADHTLAHLSPYCQLGIRRIPMSRQIGRRDISTYQEVVAMAQQKKIEILHGHGAKGGAFARLAASRLKRRDRRIRGIYTPHGGSLHYTRLSLKGQLFLDLERRLARLSDAIIFESAYSHKVYAEKIGYSNCPMSVVTNGLHACEFYDRHIENEAADFLFIGELRMLKGVDILIEALARLSKSSQVKTVIVGSGPDEGQFRKQVLRAGLEEMVTFAGPLPACQAFARGRCLVVPSRAESLPYIVLEAAAAKVPMLLTNVGGIPEIVGDRNMALLRPGEVTALVEQMQSFLQTPEQFLLEADRLQESVFIKFNVENMTRDILDIYHTVLS